MSIMFVFYGIALGIVLAAGLGVYWAYAGRGRLKAMSIGLLAMATLSLFWPLPMHGGFTFTIVEIYDELRHALTRHAQVGKQDDKRVFLERYAERFRGPLSYEVIAPLTDGWFRVMIPGHMPAWYDAGSKLLWSDWLPLDGAGALPKLEAARARCERHPPAGYWALPSEAENYRLWKSGGRRLLPRAPAGSVSFFVDVQSQLEMPSYTLRPGGGNQGGTVRTFAVRCIARSTEAPPGGYVRQDDIPLSEWNRYQLSKGRE